MFYDAEIMETTEAAPTREEAQRQIARIEHELSLPCSSERCEIGEYYIAHYLAVLEGIGDEVNF